MIFEDVQWVDSTSLELLEIILERVPRLPVLFVITLVPGMLSVLHDLKMLGGGASTSGLR